MTRQTKKTWLILAAIIMAFMPSLTSCSDSDSPDFDDKRIIGCWSYRDNDDRFYMEFRNNGAFTIYSYDDDPYEDYSGWVSDEGRFTLKNGRLVLKWPEDNETVSFKVRISDNTLVMTDEEDGSVTSLKRVDDIILD